MAIPPAEKTGPVPPGYRDRDFQPVWDLLYTLEFRNYPLKINMNNVSLSSMKKDADYEDFITILKDSLASKSNQPLPYLPSEPNVGGWYAVVHPQGEMWQYPNSFWNRIFTHQSITIGEVMDTIKTVKDQSPWLGSGSNNYPRVYFIYFYPGRKRRKRNNIQINPYLPTEENARGQLWLATRHLDDSWLGKTALNTGPANNYYFGREGVEIPFGNGMQEEPSAIYSKSYDLMREAPFVDNPFLIIPLGSRLPSLSIRTLNYPLGE